MPLRIEMESYGSPEVLRAVERDASVAGPGEALVRVAVAGVNRADLFIRSGEWPQAGGWPYVPGLELCGTVEAVGEGAGVRVGDRVITMMQRLGGIHGTRAGGYQELACVPASTLARVPDGLDLERAGMLGLPAVTAWLGLEAMTLSPGQRVLVHAGSSAVGLMALQMLAARGHETVATGTRESKFEVMRRAGATIVASTRSEDWAERVGPVDRVFDLVGEATFAASVALLRPEGRLVFVGGTSGATLSFSGWDLMKPKTLTGYSSETLDRAQLQRTLDAIAVMAACGELDCVALESFALADAGRAHEAMEAGRVTGRVVLRP